MKNKLCIRFFAFILIILCVLSSGAVVAETEDATVNGTVEVVDSAIEDDGVIRVYLSSLKAPESLNITLNGEYTVENDAGFRFDRGTQIVLSDGGKSVWMRVGGLTLDMGASLTLTRQKTDEPENGMRISQTGRETLYEGDLTVSLEENGGLRAVLAMNMEDYLCGVVAYEMSDSWPLEALKAQAVAARTYAMQRKWNAGTRDYDVVDTTADQVFRGYDAQYVNVIEAVEATDGVVGTYKGGFASCYYTASNGGEVALPSDVWSGDGDYGYLERKSDPYDLENPNSMVSSVSFSPGAGELNALKGMLEDGLKAAAAEQGLQADEMELQEITDIKPVNPVAEGSIMFQTLRFTVTASAMEDVLVPGEGDVGSPRAPGDSESGNLALYTIDYLRRLINDSPYKPARQRNILPQSFTIDLSVYDQIKDGLGLALNGGDYEVISVKKEAFQYTLEMRRFGHGVGMSQRGAQCMAGSYGMSYTEILNFYYPGMTLERIHWTTPQLQSLEDLPGSVGRARPDPTPTPTPAPLPTLEEGEYYASVALEDAGSSMNMRQQPSTQAPVVTQLAHGRRVIVCGEADGEGWVKIRTAEYTGYAKLEYLIPEE